MMMYTVVGFLIMVLIFFTSLSVEAKKTITCTSAHEDCTNEEKGVVFICGDSNNAINSCFCGFADTW